MSNQKMTTRTITTLAMITAVAFVLTMVSKLIPINIAGFLSYDPKDIVIVIAGFMFGPLSAAGVSIVVSLIEMITISDTGPIGFLMNVLSTVAFACVAAFIYKKKHNLKGAILGLICGCIAMTIVMLLWNYIVTPMYMGIEREAVAAMLLPIFLPFNLIKSGINSALTVVLYKPIVKGLRRARLIAPSKTDETAAQQKKISLGTIVVGAIIAVTLILFFLAMAGVIG